ncbi:four-carbon acid sugar kinase family protein [Streptomyces sp. sk2.1]|uniref:four-carbon acid sugar kinase family protein n=1 Tax=Streptomyces sp. sk2.1 TaxID=2478959 RepID=UPI0011E6AD75|nr:four-carbon acid sugar kinase family protein [Streptomyces sp. sk2.1]TXS64187.1 four-carbon acid sugar kinase family protein [Streptomyces sp. sk2.1]
MTSRNGTGPDIVVLADDLTSAGDGAAPFRRTGHEARILLSAGAAAPRPAPGGRTVPAPGVRAIDLGSRLLDEEAAAACTERAARLSAEAALLLKTVDSTLRGHLAAEVRAAWAGSGRRAVVIAPAFPAEGRVTVDSVQYVRGVPVHESDFARDPVHPVRCSDLAEVFPEAVAVGPDRVTELPARVGDGGLIVCSAASDADLDRLVAAVPHLDDVLWVGSPGLAAALARRCARLPGAWAAVPVPAPARRPLVVVGSANPATRRQLTALHDRADVQGVTVGDDPDATAQALRDLTAPVLTLRTPDERRTPTSARALARSLAAVVRALTGEGLVDALVVTGGETAATVLRSLGVTGVDLLDEPEPGVARGTLLGHPRVPVLIKAGGFGDDGLLLRLCDLVRQPPARGDHA